MADLGDKTQVYKEDTNLGDQEGASKLKTSNLSSESTELKEQIKEFDELSGSSPAVRLGCGDGGDQPKDTEPVDPVDG